MNNDSRQYLTVAELADRLAVSRKTIYRLVWRGELSARRVGRTIRIPLSVVSDGERVRPATGGAARDVLRSGRGSRSGIGEG